MPLLYKISCDNCDFERTARSHVTYAVLEDGAEIVLRHPGESAATAYTGKTLRQLNRASRLRLRRDYLCLNCGQVSAYGEANGAFEGVIPDTTPAQKRSANRRSVTIVRATQLRCSSCGEAALEIAGGPNGCPRSPDTHEKTPLTFHLFSFLRTGHKWKPRPANPDHTCPQCHTGTIRWTYRGIS